MASEGLRRSAGTYIQGAAQILLDLLQSLSELIPVPYVTTIVAAVSKLIEIAQGKTMQDVPKDLEQSIAKLRK
ncbi:hypothetical protein FRB93_006687 [Tulasnella sp. JGI-2019a]|nr:hypothetical protein FRB93_006687 [Tulasnella sp. JGI-2019a]